MWDKLEKSKFSMNRFLLLNTVILAILHSVQVNHIGSEELYVKPFYICRHQPGFKSNLNLVHTEPTLFMALIWVSVVIGFVHSVVESNYCKEEVSIFFLTFMIKIPNSNTGESHYDTPEDLGLLAPQLPRHRRPRPVHTD